MIKNEALNRTIIDDSYNGNEAGFLEGLRILSRAKGRKVVMTPGIVELGKDAKQVHQFLAKKYAETVDMLLLVKNANTAYDNPNIPWPYDMGHLKKQMFLLTYLYLLR